MYRIRLMTNFDLRSGRQFSTWKRLR